MTAFEFELDKLSQERLIYSERLGAIAGCREREAEIAEYLVMIERINEAAVAVARQAGGHVMPGTQC